MYKRSKSRIIAILIILIVMLVGTNFAYAEVWEFGSGGLGGGSGGGSGGGNNPYTPRGYLVSLDGMQYWLSSGFDNNGPVVYYSGVKHGVDYLDANPSGGSYTFYAMTDRNPTPGKNYLAVYKDGARIELSSYTGVPSRGTLVDPSGNGTCWVIPITGFKLDSGSRYEFFFLRGGQAHNGITLVLYPGTHPDRYLGYIKNPAGQTELDLYNAQKNDEYRFVESYTLDPDTGEYIVNLIPMRFTVQTYASLSTWQTAANEVQSFLNTVKESDYTNGLYKEENIKALRNLLASQSVIVQDEVRILLQSAAEKRMNTMVAELRELLNKAKTDKPATADLTLLTATIAEAKALYSKANINIGTKVGQYGKTEVNNLGNEIVIAEQLTKFTPQSDVDNEVKALENAIIDVKISRVSDPRLIFYDKTTGIYVILPEGALPDGTALNVIRIGESEPEYLMAKNNLSEKQTEAVLYNLEFYKSEKPISPTAAAEVQMPIADEMNRTSSEVYAVNSNGKLSKFESTRAGSVQIFTADKMGMFLMASSKAKDVKPTPFDTERMTDDTLDIMNQAPRETENPDAVENSLDKSVKNKQVYEEAVTTVLKSSIPLADFDNDMKRVLSPIYLIILAAIIATIAVVLGIRTVLNGKEERN